MEPTIYKTDAYKSPGIYKGSGGIYKGRGVYKDGVGGGDFVTIGGRKYRYVVIAGKKWIVENLDYQFCSIGGSLQSLSSPHAWYYKNDPDLYSLDGVYKVGLMYNQYAVKYLENNKNILLPNGWRVAKRSDWQDLIDLSADTSKYKSPDNLYLNFPRDWMGNNELGLTILPGGSSNTIDFLNFNVDTWFWALDNNCAVGFSKNNNMQIATSANMANSVYCRLVCDV